MFSVLILTKDEEVNVGACMASVAWCDDVVVLDSLSGDGTVTIARAGGARVLERAFYDFAGQRNFGLDEIDFKHPWVFHLDADERFNEELRAECERVIALDKRSAYFVPNRIIFMDKWIRRCTQYPYPQVRLLKIGEVRFAESGHGQKEDRAQRGVGHINVPYDHFNFSKGVEDWLEKHEVYARKEAELLSKDEPRPLREIFSKDEMIKKRAVKSWFARMPLRPWIKFVYLYVLKLGFLDGYAGWVYCRLQMRYEAMIARLISENRKVDS